MDWSPPGSYVHGISQARILEWVAKCLASGKCWTNIFTFLILPTGWSECHLWKEGALSWAPDLLPGAAPCPGVYSAYTSSLWGQGTRLAGAAGCWVAPGQAESPPQSRLSAGPFPPGRPGPTVPETTPSGVTFKFSAPPSSLPRLACSLGSSQTTPLPPSGPDSSGWLAWVPRLIQTSSWLFINSIRPYQPHHQEEGQEGLVTEAGRGVGGRQALISLPALRGHPQFSHSGFTWPGSRRIAGIVGDYPLPPAHRVPPSLSPLGRRAVNGSQLA